MNVVVEVVEDDGEEAEGKVETQILESFDVLTLATPPLYL